MNLPDIYRVVNRRSKFGSCSNSVSVFKLKDNRLYFYYRPALITFNIIVNKLHIYFFIPLIHRSVKVTSKRANHFHLLQNWPFIFYKES